MDNPTDESSDTSLSQLPDSDLLSLASRSGPKSARAFRVLYERYNSSLTNYIARRFGFKKEVVEDLVAGAWRRVHQHAHRHDSEKSKVSSWLYVIAGNLAKNELRNRDRNRETLIADAEQNFGDEGRSFVEVTADEKGRSPLQDTEYADLEEKIEEAIKTLPVQHRLPVLLRMDGYSYREIAEISGVKLGTTKSRLSRARSGLKEELALAGVDLFEYLEVKD